MTSSRMAIWNTLETYAICALRMMGACAGGDRGKEDVLTCYRMTRDALEEERGNDSLKAYEVLVALELHSLFVLVMCLCMSLFDVSPASGRTRGGGWTTASAAACAAGAAVSTRATKVETAASESNARCVYP